METDANNLVDRDSTTNALVPVIQSYSEALDNTEVRGNYLYVRGEKNAFIPVVKILGGADNGALTVTLSVEEYEALENKDPNTFYYVY